MEFILFSLIQFYKNLEIHWKEKLIDYTVLKLTRNLGIRWTSYLLQCLQILVAGLEVELEKHKSRSLTISLH